MDLYIEIIDGNLKGTRSRLRDGLTLGRKGCDLNIEDPKVSSKHARLEERPDGSFWLNMDYFNYCQGLTMTNESTPAVCAGTTFITTLDG